jgi:glycosyltransferase involved in cell wall biosynthesis
MASLHPSGCHEAALLGWRAAARGQIRGALRGAIRSKEDSSQVHVVMMLAGAARNDTRVLREAAWLARAGLEVTILARSLSGRVEFSHVAGAEIVRVPIDGALHRQAVAQRTRRRHLGYTAPQSDVLGQRAVKDLQRQARKHSNELRFSRAALPTKVLLKLRSVGAAQTRKALDRTTARLDGVWSQVDERLRDVEVGASWRHTLQGRVDDLEIAYGPVLDALEPDAIHAHDMHVLGLAVHAAYRARKRGRDVKVVYDSHEYVRGMALFGNSTRRSIAAWADLESEYIRYADEVMTVSPHIADAMQRDHDLPRRPSLLLNVPVPGSDPSTAPDLRQRCGLGPDVPLAVYSGVLRGVRGVDDAILALKDVPELHLAVVSVPSARTPQAQATRDFAAEHGVADRVHVVEPVAAPDITAYLSSATFGVIPIRGGWLSYDYALPNKFFECLAAGLPLVVSDLPTMSELVRAESIGTTFTAGEPESLTRAYREILDDLDTFTANALGSRLRAESDWRAQESLFRSVYERALGVSLRPEGGIDERPLVLEETPGRALSRDEVTPYVAIGPENYQGWGSALGAALVELRPDVQVEVTAIHGRASDPHVMHTPARAIYHTARWQASRSLILQRRLTHAVWEEGKAIGGDFNAPTCMDEARRLVSSGGRGVVWLHRVPGDTVLEELGELAALGVPVLTGSQEVADACDGAATFVAPADAPTVIARHLEIGAPTA